ncbi:MAG: DUF2088 domain-containing protein [Planctomycetales bacterium]|nr:DUF2088 domain-containing protein [Planctomycetales bacterium]
MDVLQIDFGPTARWELPADERIASCAGPEPIEDDLSAAIERALLEPIEFPSLDQAVVPGDKLVLAVDAALPALAEVVSHVVHWFCQRGCDPANLHVVLSAGGTQVAPELAAAICQRLGASVSVEVHDPDDPEKRAYVAANEASDPIYLNRSMVDADVIISLSAARHGSALDYFGAFSLFPLFSDRLTRGRFYSLPRLDDHAAHDALRAWADQAAWWVGLVAGIQLVPAQGNGVHAVLAGQLEPLEAASQRAMAQTWDTPSETSELVVASLDGGDSQQTWLHLARALHTASHSATSRGSIVLCTDLSESPGRGLNRLRATHRSVDALAKKLAADDADDAIAAAVLLQTTAHYHVYLVSNLREETVESLGMGVVHDQAELARLIDQHAGCRLLRSAQHCGARFQTSVPLHNA